MDGSCSPMASHSRGCYMTPRFPHFSGNSNIMSSTTILVGGGGGWLALTVGEHSAGWERDKIGAYPGGMLDTCCHLSKSKILGSIKRRRAHQATAGTWLHFTWVSECWIWDPQNWWFFSLTYMARLIETITELLVSASGKLESISH